MNKAPIPPATGEVMIKPVPRLRAVAEAQKLLLWSILASLLVVIPYLGIVAYVFQIWAIYNTAKALQLPNIWMWVIGTMIPLFGLLVLLRMNGKATNMLQAAGVPVGLMGAKMDRLPD